MTETNDLSPLDEYIAFLAMVASGGSADWNDIVTRGFHEGVGLPEEVMISHVGESGAYQRYSACAIAMRMGTAKIALSAAPLGTWHFKLEHPDGDHIIAAGPWTLPYLIITKLRGLASWQLQQFLAAVTKIEDKKTRDFVLNAPCKTRLPLTDLCSMFADQVIVLITSHSGWDRQSVIQFELTEVCDMAMSPTFQPTWQMSAGNLVLHSPHIQHNLFLKRLPIPILTSLVWRELHMPT